MLIHARDTADGTDAEQSSWAPEHLRGVQELTDFFIRRSTHRELPTQTMERARAWVRALHERGALPEFHSAAEELRRAGAPFTLPGSPTPVPDVLSLEAQLGFMLPSAYRTFLIRFGTAQFLHAWRDTMLSVRDVVAHSKVGDLDLVPICRYHGRGTYLIACDAGSSAPQAPVYLQLDGESRLYEEARSFQIWFGRKVNVVMEEISNQLQDGHS